MNNFKVRKNARTVLEQTDNKDECFISNSLQNTHCCDYSTQPNQISYREVAFERKWCMEENVLTPSVCVQFPHFSQACQACTSPALQFIRVRRLHFLKSGKGKNSALRRAVLQTQWCSILSSDHILLRFLFVRMHNEDETFSYIDWPSHELNTQVSFWSWR